MGLEDRLNSALSKYNLQTILPPTKPKISQPRKKSPPNIKIFEDLNTAITNAPKIKADEDGIKQVLIKNINLEKISLPMTMESYTIDDIQRRRDGIYVVHLIESD